jgi:hypothetical protein
MSHNIRRRWDNWQGTTRYQIIGSMQRRTVFLHRDLIGLLHQYLLVWTGMLTKIRAEMSIMRT